MDTPSYITHVTSIEDSGHLSSNSLGMLFSAVYSDIEHLARGLMNNERPGHTLGTHGLMHEAYVRLLATYQQTGQLEDMDHGDIRALTAVVMRRVLVDHARKRGARGRANEAYTQCVERSCQELSGLVIDLVLLEESLVELESVDPRKARVVELRFFGGMQMVKIAHLINCPLRTVERDWAFARAWLCSRIRDKNIGQGSKE